MSTVTDRWSAKISAWRHSGLSLAAWCRDNGESYHRALHWRKRLQEGDDSPAHGRFLELLPPSHPLSLECNGVVVHVSRGFDAGLLADVLSVLKRG
ncbi:MAG: hypothetical protein M0T70_06450 [Geobacteraceae bacterium]|nr:hypothetical protein [Geobacteraceae bacterium]